MNDPLTVPEVERLARRLRGELTSIPIGVKDHPGIRAAVSNAQATVDELLLLCELVDVVESGIAVVLEQSEPPA